MKTIHVFTPATVANVSCGFDVLGFAVNNPGDEVILRLTAGKGVKLTKIEGDNGLLPLDPLKNTVTVSIINYLKHIGSDVGVEVELYKKMPVGSGLGSSSASTVAGVFAINEILGKPLTKKELLPFAIEGERIACGQGHADNVAPALMGGFVLIRSYEPLDVIKLPVPSKLISTLIHPQIEISTRNARLIIREKVSLKDATAQWGNVAGLITGLFTSDYDLISRSMHDGIIEPVRKALIPFFDDMKQLALANGALGFGISGSGPSVFALSTSEEVAQRVGNIITAFLAQHGVANEVYVSRVNEEGPKVLN
jgi:homoserine kinase